MLPAGNKEHTQTWKFDGSISQNFTKAWNGQDVGPTGDSTVPCDYQHWEAVASLCSERQGKGELTEAQRG